MRQADLLPKPVPPPIVLREYQDVAIDGIRNHQRGGMQRLLLQAACGAGKTIIAAALIRLAVEGDFHVVFLAHRRELIKQCSDKLHRFGVDHGIIMAGERRKHYEHVQVASIQTLWSRAILREVMDLPGAHVIVIDEAHRSLSRTYLELIKRYPNAVVLGLTATPVRSDGRGLGHVYEAMIMCPPISELIKLGHLVPVRYYAPSIPDLRGVKITAGDYNEKQLEKKMDKDPLIGDIVGNWVKICPTRKTVVFASGVKHSIHIAERFCSAGIRARHIDGNTPKDERDEVLRDLEFGDLQVVSNCGVLIEGWDCPVVSCAILARPTKSIGLYIQLAGRILRPSPGKDDALLIDHSGAVYEHGFIDEFADWSLDKDGKIQDRVKQKRKTLPTMITCQNCKFVYFPKSDHCPECGHFYKKWGRDVNMADGDLEEVKTGKKAASKLTKQEWYSQFLWYGDIKGYRDGWTSHKYKEKFGVWPRNLRRDKVQAGPEVLAYIKSRNIAYARAREQARVAMEAEMKGNYNKPWGGVHDANA